MRVSNHPGPPEPPPGPPAPGDGGDLAVVLVVLGVVLVALGVLLVVLGGSRLSFLISVFLYPSLVCASFFYLRCLVGSYIDELLGGTCPDLLPQFGPLPKSKNTPKTQKPIIQNSHWELPFWRPLKKEICCFWVNCTGYIIIKGCDIAC